MRQYETFELSFQAAAPEGSWALADLKAEFTREAETVRVEGFYAGYGVYKVRFYPRRPGIYQWKACIWRICCGIRERRF